MGIPKFFQWFSNTDPFNNSIYEYKPQSVDVLCLDLNGIIHRQAGKVFLGDTLNKNFKIIFVYEGVVNEIINLCKQFKPTVGLYVAVDGVAPQAKINQQRKRRYVAAANRHPDQVFDTNAISPGTEFMLQLDLYLEKRLKELNQLAPYVEYSGSSVPGEGEHKIANYLRRAEGGNKTVMIHGSDADLIMIYSLILNKDYLDIIVMRESDMGYPTVYISLKTLQTILIKLYNNANQPVDDFVVIMFLNGNDFLPHFPSFEIVPETLGKLVVGYYNFLKEFPTEYLTDIGGIVWKNLIKFLDYIVLNYNHDLLLGWVNSGKSLLAKTSSKITNVIMNGVSQGRSDFDEQKFNKVWYDHVFSTKPGMVEITKIEISDMVFKYVEGIAWVYNYYKYGEFNINVEWYYPYHYAPLFQDVPKYLKTYVGQKWLFEPTLLTGKFISPIDQLVMIIPPKSIHLIPSELRKLYSESSPIIDIMPDSFHIDGDGKMESWQAIAILPIPNPARVIYHINKLNLHSSFLINYESRIPLVVNFNPILSNRQFKSSRFKSAFVNHPFSPSSTNETDYRSSSDTESRYRGSGYRGSDRGSEYRGSDRQSGYRGSDRQSGYRGSDRGSEYRGSGYRGSDRGSGYRGSDRGSGYRRSDRGSGYRGSDRESGYRGTDRGSGYRGSDRGSGYRGTDRGSGYRGTDRESGYRGSNRNEYRQRRSGEETDISREMLNQNVDDTQTLSQSVKKSSLGRDIQNFKKNQIYPEQSKPQTTENLIQSDLLDILDQ